MALSAGPKKRVSDEPLPFCGNGSHSDQFSQWCERFIKVQNGFGKGEPFRVRDWQKSLIASVLDTDPAPRLCCWLLARANGKTSLLAALSVYKLFTSDVGGAVVCCARTKDQAQLLFRTARDYVETSPELLARCQVGRERLYVPGNRTSFECLVSEPQSLEGLNFSFCAVDEIGVTPRETLDVLQLAQGKRPQGESVLLAVGTPPHTPDGSVLIDWRNLARDTGDEFVVYREYSADGFDDHDLLCEHCIRLANPAYGDFLAMDVFERDARTAKPMAYRRSRLGQFVFGGESPLVGASVWDGLASDKAIPDGADVVVAFDGSTTTDHTAILVGTVEPVPHFDTVAVFDPKDTGGRVDVFAVEAAIRRACQRWNVREIIADPWMWTRTLQLLAAEGITVHEFPQRKERLTKATTDLHTALTNGGLTHTGDLLLRAHVLAADVVESEGGVKLSKVSRSRNAPKIDLAACLVMGYSRTSWLASQKPKKRRVITSR
ncbi:terminase [Mycolicibacterium vanbaalenii]|uniref:terminase large subunit domain-containing protein n=1 Tax=Mycolicibacterium vanbaalenii TaxID=110539 RepID=UPI001F1E4442|nr:terminase large subunit [Mycolicibacterium vanbaalenii]UJL27009.1 terminase [Mycolicibacterium vanbaalenii]WND59132.1 terminase large subunit [Mycolicibacterium vanbaalenii]